MHCLQTCLKSRLISGAHLINESRSLRTHLCATVELVHDSQLWRQQPVSVSGILITYNQDRFIADALHSVLNQTYPMDIIISDDCSSDETPAVIRRILAGYKGSHRITMNTNCKNQGICGNQNLAI